MHMATMHIANPAEPAATLHGGGAAGAAESGDSGAFASLLRGLNGSAGAGGEGELREAAEQLVGLAFVTPMMKMMRDEPFKTDLFHGGIGEEMFAAQLDEHLAERMSRGMGLPVVDAVYERFAGRIGDGRPAHAGGAGQEVDRHG